MSTNNISTDVPANPTQVQKAASTRYSPLLHDGDSFRLLRVLPSLRQGSPLRCESFTSSISRERDQYIAGSYVWGPPEPKRSILLDGGPFQVRDNLFRFLKAFRSRYQPRVIWLDAICINQDDIQERSHQVQEMKRIYSGAKCVYSWLGYDKSLPHTGIFNRQYVSELYFWCLRDERQRKRQRSQLEYIAKAEYWSRMWIVQEFILAQDVHLLLGKDKLSYSKLDKIMQGARLFDSSTGITPTKYNMFALLNYRSEWKTFEGLFETFGMLPRSVPLDGVFALLGLLEGNEKDLRLISIADYNLSVWQLLQQILALDIVKSSLFKFAEQYNRYVIEGQRDDYMGGYVGLRLMEAPSMQPRGADGSRYARTGGSLLEISMATETSRAFKHCEDGILEVAMYTPRWRTISGQSGVSVGLSWYVESVDSLSTRALVEACDSRCVTTCATHAVFGFSWRFRHKGMQIGDPALTASIDVPLLTSYASRDVSRLIYDIQQRSMEMVEAISSKLRMTAGDRFGFHTTATPYKLETDVDTIVTLSTFIRDLETHNGWQGLLELAMECTRKPGAEEDVTRPK